MLLFLAGRFRCALGLRYGGSRSRGESSLRFVEVVFSVYLSLCRFALGHVRHFSTIFLRICMRVNRFCDLCCPNAFFVRRMIVVFSVAVLFCYRLPLVSATVDAGI